MGDVISLPIYTMDEVKKHNQWKDRWIVINGYVYDITHFHHPTVGGPSAYGSDCTKEFWSSHVNGRRHLNKLKKYRIGKINNCIISIFS